MKLKMYVYLEQPNVLSSLGIEGEENDYETHIVDLNITQDAIVGFYVLPNEAAIILFTTVETFRIVYDHQIHLLLEDVVRNTDGYEI